MGVLADYATFWEKLGEPARSLELWRKTYSLDVRFEPGYYEASRLLMAASRDAEGLPIAEAGLSNAPDSVRLHLTRAEMLERLGRPYDSRRALDTAAARLSDLEVLRRRAAQEDFYGKSSALAYRKLAEALDHAKASPDELSSVLRRGLTVSLRDNNTELAAWFRERSGSQSVEKTAAGSITSPGAPEGLVPGGLAGMAFAARVKKRTFSSTTYFQELSRTLAEGLRHRRRAQRNPIARI
ncbi:MAG: hypothetical protein QM757_22535 [Paludibaculum sp.]